MAHDNYLSLISLSLDNLLAEDEQSALEKHLQFCAACALAWNRMSLVDQMLKVQPEAAPSVDFKAHVMARVSSYEKRQHLYPWMTLILTTILLVAMASVVLPVLFVTLGLYKVLFEVPVVGSLFTRLADTYAQIVAFVGTIGVSAVRWISSVTTDPMALAAVVTALVAISIWAGMREALKLKPVVEISAQSA